MLTNSISVRAFARPVIFAAASLIALLATVVLAPVGVAQSDDSVTITTTLEPVQLEIDSGTTVTWTNEDTERHRVRSKDGPEEFDSGNLDPGESFSYTFTIEGSYPYYDHRDRDDTDYFGMIIVGGAGGATDGPLPERGEVSIINRSFQPPSFSIATGGTIEWSNDDGEAHTVTSTDSAFDSGILNGGATFTQTFTEAGSFPYSCLIHPEMRGTITVNDPIAGPTQAASSSAVPVTEVPGDQASTEPDPGTSVDASPGVDATSGPAASALVDASPGVDASAAPTIGAAVSIIDRSFRPGEIEIHPGDTVSWSNDDGQGHTVTAVNGEFDSGVLAVGAEFSTVFETAGSYDFFCAIHPDMTGTVIVAELAG